MRFIEYCEMSKLQKVRNWYWGSLLVHQEGASAHFQPLSSHSMYTLNILIPDWLSHYRKSREDRRFSCEYASQLGLAHNKAIDDKLDG